jgi:predicted porin
MSAANAYASHKSFVACSPSFEDASASVKAVVFNLHDIDATPKGLSVNRSHISLAMLLTIAGTASAQSSVTVFGLLDTSIGHYKDSADNVTKLGQSGLSPSRLGFRGAEDLGGGMAAEFWLESSLQVDTGGINASGKFWHRRSTVSLMGGFGELRLGRDRSTVYATDFGFEPFYDVGVAASGGVSRLPVRAGNTSPTTVSYLDNAISYVLPKSLGGVTGQFQVAPGEGIDAGKFAGGSLGYALGSLSMTAAYGETSTAPYKFKYSVLGASYDFGPVKLMGRYTQKKLGDVKYDNYGLGGTIPVGPGLIRGSVVFNRGGGLVDGDNSTLYGLGYVHNLSKRTALFATVAYVKNKGNGVGYVYGAPAGIPGESSSGYEFGIRHSF